MLPVIDFSIFSNAFFVWHGHPKVIPGALLALLLVFTSLTAGMIQSLTASAMPRDVARGKAAGFAEYLTQPLNFDSFLKTVDLSLENAP